MGTSNKSSKVSRQARIQKVIAGIQKHFLNLNQTALMLGGVSYPPTDVTKLLQADIDASNRATATRAQLTSDVKAERDSHHTVDPLLRFIRSYVVGLHGDTENAATVLADFGFSPRKVPTKSAEVKAEAAGKMRATRAARMTMGARQKAKVKGVVAPQPSTDGAATKAPEPPAANPPVAPKPTA